MKDSMHPPIPFSEPLLALAYENEAQNRTQPAYEVLKGLSQISRFAFDQDYQNFQRRQKFMNLLQPGTSTQATLPAYLNGLQEEQGRTAFSARYPLLSHLKKTYLKQTQQFEQSVRKNYESDRAKLATLLNHGVDFGDILQVEMGLGDVHNNGESTSILHFKNDQKLVYKPRSGGLDAAFYSLLEQASKAGGDLNSKP
ncbi:DUF4135 domain-containing protein [bacterium SCSIO 12741]|nr:DUF4135 domain-containing protein [bacterium SCSIO 12741]